MTKNPYSNPKICFFCTFPPRECGIATFSKDLTTAMDKKFNPKLKSKIIAINENQNIYNYGKKVIETINADDIEDYIEIAKKINENPEIKIISLQHEFGLFGGEYGSYLIPFLETVNKPVVVTFHSIIPDPDEMRKKIVKAIAVRSSAIVVMAKKAIEILVKDYEIEREKIYFIPHGIPNVEFQSSETFKKKLNLQGKIVLSTFGLLNRGKGIEYVLKALPSLIENYPNLLYLVVGETHPVVRREEGEEYRNYLLDLVEQLNLKKNVKFYNKYLTLQEIIEYLLATDIYIFSGLDKDQITSGTLAYAMGCGKAVISTSTAYSEEMLANGRGIIVKPRSPTSYSKAIKTLLSNPEQKREMEKAAYAYTRQMIWTNVAQKYLKIFNKIIKLREEVTEKFPKIKLTHLKKMSDDFGIIQFAKHSEPDKNSGYTLDDNSRALIVAVLHHKLTHSPLSYKLAKIYLNFLKNAQGEDGNFKNNFQNKNEYLDSHSEDSFGRALWSLGLTINKSISVELIEEAESLFLKSFPRSDKVNSPRAKAFCLIGLCYYYRNHKNEKILEKIKKLADSLSDLYDHNSSEEWQWFESYLTYANGKLPEALFLAYEATKNERYLKIAKKTLDFLSEICIADNKIYPIGQNGWYKRKDERALFDQQPIEASSLVQVYLTAYSITQNHDYYKKAVLSFNWFLGNNHLNQMIYDETTGGCFDGLGKHSLNLNQGAEATVCYLIARLFFAELKYNRKKGNPRI